jgi:HemX protein
MPPDRLALTLSTLAFLAAMVQAGIALKVGRWQQNVWNIVLMALGLVGQTAFLILRGQLHGRCPLTNLYEVFIFIGWSIVLLYFFVGAAYRLSLLGLFTSPLVALLQGMALVFQTSVIRSPGAKNAVRAWMETHAALSLMAYAAFALACVTGVMFLVQERLLKQHRIASLFYQLPPIHELGKVITRLIFWGLILLSVGLAASFKLNLPSSPKLIMAWGVWAQYIIIALMLRKHVLGTRQSAWLAVGGFVVPFASLWIVTKA